MYAIKNKPFTIAFILCFTTSYYAWLLYWQDGSWIQTFGGNIFSVAGTLIPAIWLFKAYKDHSQKERVFWLLMALGAASYCLAEIFWIYYESLLRLEVPFPGTPDLFYILQVIFYSAAFMYMVAMGKRTYRTFKYIIDILIVMTVAATFSWRYLISTILDDSKAPSWELIISLFYPVGDLALLLGAVIIYLTYKDLFRMNGLLYIFIGILIQIYADSVFLYLNAVSNYSSGSLIDPLFILALFVVGFAGFHNNPDYKWVKGKSTEQKDHDQDFIRLLLPYMSIVVLLCFMIFETEKISVIKTGAGITIMLVSLNQILMIVENKRNQEKIRFMAYHDSLTGLPNRGCFEANLKDSIDEARREQSSLAVMFIDLDRFKVLNDTLGHHVGDQLLISVSRRLEGYVSGRNMVARQGGDEFTILTRGMDDRKEIEQFAAGILELLNKPYCLNGHEIKSSPSIGVAIFPDDGDDASTLMKNADIAMYRVKENGKNNFGVNFLEMKGDLTRKLIVENDLHHALKKNEFVIHYQPLIDVKSEKISGVEALIRWSHPKLGLISPGEFIPIAEETGLIFPISKWILRSACMQVKAWHRTGHFIKLGVNFSPREFHQRSLVEMISGILEETDLEPKYLDIEITEGIAIKGMDIVIPKLRELQMLGVNISIDDFGTGYSSLSYLTKLPINTLKIDQQFTRQIGENIADEAIISSIVTIAKNLDLDIIAEGVETERQSNFLQNLDCYHMQGYLYSKPLPASDLEELLNRRNQ